MRILTKIIGNAQKYNLFALLHYSGGHKILQAIYRGKEEVDGAKV